MAGLNKLLDAQGKATADDPQLNGASIYLALFSFVGRPVMAAGRSLAIRPLSGERGTTTLIALTIDAGPWVADNVHLHAWLRQPRKIQNPSARRKFPLSVLKGYRLAHVLPPNIGYTTAPSWTDDRVDRTKRAKSSI